jgi:signal transduction histidine kinase
LFRVKSVFLKLFITYVTILFVSFFVLSTISYLLFQNDFNQRNRDLIYNQLNRVVQYIQHANEKGWDQEILISSLELSISKQDKVFYLFDQFGSLIYQVGESDVPLSIDQKMVQKVLKGERQFRKVQIDENHDKSLFIVASPIGGPGLTKEKAIVMVSYGFDRDFNRMKYLFLMAIIITIVIAGLFILYVSKRITAPVREMNRIALRLAKGKFDQKVNVSLKDEIGQLAETFNFMAEELASLDQMRKDFVANVSHDLRSPLTSIHGFLTAFLDRAIPVERHKDYILIMREQTERLIKLVNDLLDMARMEAKQFEIHPIHFNLTEQIRKVVARMEPDLVKSQIQVRMVCDKEEDIFVFADQDRIDQVMVNLIQNAIQFSPSCSTVDVMLQKRDRAVIAVRDYGPGIKAEEMQFIWNRFYKGDKARSKKVGTGIGLAIVKHILDLHGTEIEVHSELGKGTSFIFTLPLLNNQK